MRFISGIFLIDAPASALNNRGTVARGGQQNIVEVKSVRTEAGYFPYVSAQALRYWIRTSIPEDRAWQAAPVHREEKIAYSDGNPILYADDDLFGYMRAKSKKADAGASVERGTETAADLTRVSPFRVGSLMSVAPLVALTRDFGTMTRSIEGNPVPHDHEFYRTVLRAPFSLDLGSAGVFSYRRRTGFLNLDENRQRLAEERGLVHDGGSKTYALSIDERSKRCATLLRTMGVIDGGAKQTLHYTDTTPTLAAFAVFEGGNNPLYYLFGSDGHGGVRMREDVISEVASVWKDRIRSPLYLGWRSGFCDGERERTKQKLVEMGFEQGVVFEHPRDGFNRVADDLEKHAAEWMR